MIPRTKKIIIILLIGIFLLPSLSVPLYALAQGQAGNAPASGQPAAQAGSQPAPQDPQKKADEKKDKKVQETPVTWGESVIQVAVTFIANILSGFLAVIIYLEAYIINYILGAFQFTKAPIVTLGWGITRDLANMLFILALIIIAISTILRVKNFTAQQMLWRVIVAALLVNFSLVIGGIVIDFTQVVTQYFIKAATGDGAYDFASRLASSMSITSFYAPGTGAISLVDVGKSVALVTLGSIFKLIALVIAVFVFGATAVFLVLRVAWLWLLLLVAPLAWALWAFPGQSKWFSDWWSNFLKWAFFAPVYAVSIFLALSMAAGGGFNITSAVPSNSAPQAFSQQADYVSASAPQVILQFVVMVILFMVPLLVAQKIGVTGAQGAIKIGKKWSEGTKNFAGRQLRRGTYALTKPLAEGEKTTGLRGRVRTVGAGLGGVAAAIPGLRGAYVSMATAETKAYDDLYKQYKDVDPKILQNMLKTPAIAMDPRKRTAIEQGLAEAGELKYDATQREAMFRRAKGYGKEKNFQELFPVTAARVLGKSMEEIARKIKNAANIYVEELEEAVPHLSPKQLRDVGSSGNDEKRRISSLAIDNKYNALPITEQREVSRILGIKDKKVREEETAGLPPELRKILSQRAITLSPRWELNV